MPKHILLQFSSEIPVTRDPSGVRWIQQPHLQRHASGLTAEGGKPP